MRLIYLFTVIAGVAFVASLVLNPGFTHFLSRLGKTEFYVYIVDPGRRILASATPRSKQKTFVYHLPAIDEQGAQKALTFTSPEQLSLYTYVRLYVSSAGTVTAWEEIPTQQLPQRIKDGQTR